MWCVQQIWFLTQLLRCVQQIYFSVFDSTVACMWCVQQVYFQFLTQLLHVVCTPDLVFDSTVMVCTTDLFSIFDSTVVVCTADLICPIFNCCGVCSNITSNLNGTMLYYKSWVDHLSHCNSCTLCFIDSC